MNEREILTERTRMKLIALSDLNSIHELHSLPETDEYNTLGIPKDIEETKSIITAWIAENQQRKIKNYTFAIKERETRKFIGLFGHKLGSKKYKSAEVWYKIHIDFWNKGYATETLKAVINFGFDSLDLHRVQAGCAVENIASLNVLEKSGMIKEGRRRQILPLKSGWSDNFEYSILDTDERKN